MFKQKLLIKSIDNKTKLTVVIVVGLLFIGSGMAWASNNWPLKSNSKSVTYYPQPINDVLINPYMGIAPEADDIDNSQPHSLVYAGVSWKELEPEKGQYDFVSFEKRINYDYWKEKGTKIILRIYLDYPRDDFHADIPNWLYYETNKDGTWYKGSYGKGFSPNYSNPKIILYHDKLIKAVADRYKNDNNIAFIELGSIGHWGEWHTQYAAKYKVAFPPEKVYNQYVQHYIRYFSSKPLLIRRPIKLARANNMGLYNDSFGNIEQTEDCFIKWYQNGYLDDLTASKQPAMPDFWKKAPSGGEFAAQPGEECLDNNAISRTLKQLTLSHTSWLGPNCPADQISDPVRQKNWESLLKKMGYRYVIRSVTYKNQVKPGEKVNVELVIENTGIAPFYFNWPLELSLANSNEEVVARYKTNDDIRKWLPGVTKVSSAWQIPRNLPAGKYTLCIAILDPANNQPGIELAIKGKRPDKRYTIGQIDISRTTQ